MPRRAYSRQLARQTPHHPSPYLLRVWCLAKALQWSVMPFGRRVSLQSASDARRRAHNEIATRSPLVGNRAQERTMHSTSFHSSHTTPSASDCRWKRGRPVTSPIPSTRAFSGAYPVSRLGARHSTDIALHGTLSRRIASVPRFSQADCTPSTCTAAAAMHSSHHTTAAPTFDSSTDTHTSTIIRVPSQGHTSFEDLHDLPDAVTSGNAATTGMHNPMEQAIGLASVVETELKEESGEESAGEQHDDPSEEHIPLDFQIPEEILRAAMLASPNTRASYWSQNLYRGPDNAKLSVHYCPTMEVADRVAQYFLSEKVVGFDVEWKPRASPSSIKKNASLVQLACENRIALFHISMFPGTTAEELMPANLKAVLESPDVCKVGVAVKGDFSRLNKYLGIQAQGVFELSRLRNLVEWYATDRSKVSNRLVGLAAQVLQHLQLPLYKGGSLLDDAENITNVRESDWSQRLNLQQIHYAAADAYAGFRLYDVLEWKRKQLRPTPPRPQLCDYDSKPAPKSKDRRKKPETIKPSKDLVDVDAAPSTSAASQERELDETSEEDGYETAQEDLMDSHQLEGPVPASSLASSAGINKISEARHEQIGRANLSWLEGSDPDYPVLYPVLPEISDNERAISQVTNSDTPLSILLEGRTSSVNSTSQISDEDPSASEDEFADPELEEALQALELDSNGTLKRKTSKAIAGTAPQQENSAEQPAPAESEPDFNSPTHTPQYTLATTWAQNYLTSSIPPPGSSAPSRIRATVPHLRAYHLWNHQQLPLAEVARHLRDPPLSLSTVGGYVLQAITLEDMRYDEQAVREVVMGLPEGLKRGRWRRLAERLGAFG